MNTTNPSVPRRRAVRRLGVAAALSVGPGIAALSETSASATTEPPTTEPATPPIAAEEFTRLDAETAVRGSLTDEVTATISITRGGMDPVMIDIADLSNIAVGRFTVQPGAQFPWHTHAGPVIVSVVEGELVYVMHSDCSEHSYPAGTAFVDAGHGEVHSAYNPTDAPTVIVATFLEAPADGPLVITEGVTAPADNCGLPTS
jgi:quercetin dioxygenase-like cupin family protein